MKNLNKLIQYFSEYDLYNNMLSNEIKDKRAKDVLLENCDFRFASVNMAIQKTENILSALKSKLDMSERGKVKKLIQSYIADEISLTKLFESLPLKSQNFLDTLKSKVDEIKRDRSFHLFYPVYMNCQKHIQQPLITFSCELTDDTFQINKLYANKNILALLIAQQKNLEIASVREQYEKQLDEISSAVDSLHKSRSFFDLYQVVCGEFKHVMGADLTEFRSAEGWQMLEKALISFEALDNIIENCFRDELESLKRYYEKDAILPDTVKRFLALSETKTMNISDTNYAGFHLGSYQAEYSVNKKQWQLVKLSKQSKLLCVEGPPGTGKTTLLKEMIADTLVQKADRLLEVWNEKWTDMGGKTEIKCSPLLGKNLNSIMISSTNNKAVDNIGLELLKEIPFFSDFTATINSEEEKYAGILCARLGKSKNIGDFYKSFFKTFQSYLDVKTITDEESENARNTYTQLHKKLHSVNQEISDLLAYRSRLGSFASLEEIEKKQAALKAKIESLEGQKSYCNGQISERDEILSQIRNYLDAGKQSLSRVDSEIKTIEAQLHTLYSDLKIYESMKGIKCYFSFLFPEIRSVKKKYGSSEQIRDTIQEHRNTIQKYKNCLNEMNSEMGEKRSEQVAVTSEMATLKSTLAKTEAELIDVSQRCDSLISYFSHISTLGKKEVFTGINLLSDDVFKLRNMPAIMKLRNELFLASLRLFEAYIIMNKEPILHNLKIILTEQDDSGGGTAYYNWCSALYNGDEPYQEDKASLVRILWETFFLCFPVVTTTLHSFRKSTFPLVPDLFDLLMVDEGGQILPYYVVAPLYRARRAVFVGDVNQIEPIRSVPANMLELRYSELLGSKCYSRFCIDSASAQSYASLASDYYENIGKKVGGVILNQHRRCEPSIMAFSNEHIYLKILDIIGDDNHNKLFGKNLVAFDVRGFKAKEHYNQAEIDACKQIVNLLIQEYGDDVKKNIGIITPFSRQAAKLREAMPGIDAGTVHVFQGDEKEFILFSSVVDSTPDMEGLYHFIGSKGNLLNVAFSRAKKQFIYIGNLQAAKNAGNYLKLAMETLTKYGRIFSLFDTHQLTDNSFLEDSNIVHILTGGRSGDVDDEIGNYLQKMIPKNIIDTPRMHNEILNEVLLLSKSSMHIISPWIGSNVVTASMLDTIHNKIHDDVQIHIVFGHKAVRCSLDDIDELVKKDIPWRKEDAANVIRSLKELLGDMLQFSPPSHVKLLLVDDRYLFIGSLNWLFNSGRTDQKEISCLVTNPDTITYVKDRFLMKN